MALAVARVEWGPMAEGASNETTRYPIRNTTQLYEGQFVQLDNGGRLKPYAADATGIDGGLALGMVQPTRKDNELATYLLGATALSPVPEAIVFTGSFLLKDVAVTGAASQADVGKLCYLDADNTAGDHTLTLTAGTNGKAAGRVTKWHSATRCEVRVFGYAERAALN